MLSTVLHTTPKKRTKNSVFNRFGFQNDEKDDEVYGAGNSYTAEFWQYDPRLGRRWNLDPMQPSQFIGWSPYSVLFCNPLKYIDPTGLAPETPDDYSIDKKGNVKLEKKTGDEFDNLYAKDDYNKGNLNNGIRINDRTILPSLSKEGTKVERQDAEGFVFETGRLKYATNANKNEVLKFFIFAAKNTEVEWSAYSMEDGKAAIGTFQFNDLSPSPSNMKLSSKSVLSMIHSHPNPTLNTEVSSLFGDRGVAMSVKYDYYTYMPKSSNLYKINNQNGGYTLIKKADFNTLLKALK